MSLGLDEAGTGDTVVLVHGVGTSRTIWRHAVPLIGVNRRAVAVDLPGFGQSSPVGEGFDIQSVAGALAARLAVAGIQAPYDLVGHSLGGAVAASLADQFPERIRRLVLSAPAGLIPRPRALAGLLGLGAAGLVRARRDLGPPLLESRRARALLLAGAVADGGSLPPGDAAAMLEASRGALRVKEGVAAAVATDMRPVIARLEVPLGILWGAEDRVIPPATAEAILSSHPDAPVETIPGAAHVPMMEAPGKYSSALERTLRSLVGDIAEGDRT